MRRNRQRDISKNKTFKGTAIDIPDNKQRALALDDANA
jgi:hypothetical protein